MMLYPGKQPATQELHIRTVLDGRHELLVIPKVMLFILIS